MPSKLQYRKNIHLKIRSPGMIHQEQHRAFSEAIRSNLLLLVFALLISAKAVLIIFLSILVNNGTVLYTGTIPETPEILLALGYQWDSRHFLSIAQSGYPLNPDDPLLYAFAPFYPFMISVVGNIINSSVIAGVLISNVFYFASIWSFQKVARLYVGYERACAISLLFGLFPTYLVYGTLAYSEAPFIFFSTLSWFYFQKSKHPVSSVLLTLSILTRFIGVLIFGIYLLIGLRRVLLSNELKPLERINFGGAAWFIIPVLSTILLLFYFYIRSGDFLITIVAHDRFDDSLGVPVVSQLIWYFEGFFAEANPWVDPLQLAVERYVFVLPYLLLSLAHIKWNEETAIYASVMMVFVTSLTGIAAIAAPRIMLAAWPSILPLARLKRPLLLFSLGMLFLVASCWVMLQVQTGFFA